MTGNCDINGDFFLFIHAYENTNGHYKKDVMERREKNCSDCTICGDFIDSVKMLFMYLFVGIRYSR